MNDYPLLRVGIVVTIFAVIGTVLYGVFADDFGEWFQFMESGEEYNLQVGIGRDYETILVNGTEIQVEVADTPEETRRGLSGRESIGDDEGMLFVFHDTRQHTFWMKDMKFDIDIIWIRDGVVVEIAENMPAPQGSGIPATYRPDEAADMVLELNAGRASELGIRNGTRIEGLPLY